MRMNHRQRWVLVVGAALVVVSCLFPPWIFSERVSNTVSYVRPGAYRFLFAPGWEERHFGEGSQVWLDFGRLSLEWVIIVVLTAVGVFLLAERR